MRTDVYQCQGGHCHAVSMDLMCPSRASLFRCTRPLGHDGDHVACAITCNAHMWTDDQATGFGVPEAPMPAYPYFYGDLYSPYDEIPF